MKPPSKLVLSLLGAAFVATLLLAWAASRRSLSRTDPVPGARISASAGVTGSLRPSAPSIAPHTAPDGVAAAPEETRTVAPRASRPRVDADDPVLHSLQPELAFANRIRELRALAGSAQIAKGRELLSSSSAEDRALGGVLLFLNASLNDRLMQFVADDRSLSVPLVVFDWIRDFGSDDEIAAFAALLGDRDIPTEDLVAYASASAAQPGGGRSALDLLIPRFDEEELEEGLLPVASAKGASYDVREQALFKLFEPEFRNAGLASVEELAAGLPADGSSLLAEATAKWSALAHLSDEDIKEVPYKVWDTPLRDVSFMAESGSGLAVRDMANYLEYGLRRDDPDFEPVIEEGTWQAAKDFLDRAQTSRAALLPEDAEALDRIAACLDRIKAYDPAFAPGADEDDPLDDQVISDEILNAEDFYVAEYLTSDDEGEDPDEEENPPGVSDDEEEDDADEESDDEEDDDEASDDGEDEEEDDDDGDEAGDEDSDDEDDEDSDEDDDEKDGGNASLTK